jgi:small subunit ribosomal protein S16
MGTKKRPFFRIVIADSRSPRDGKFIEQVGIYHPLMDEGKQVIFNKEKVKKWFFQGAKPTQIVKKLLNRQGFRFDRILLEKE